MSKRKQNIAYVKPQEPAFLSRLKKEAGYKEGPTVDTKREQLPTNSSDDSDNEEQQPQIVVLNPGDLTADEVAKAKKLVDEAPADLTKRVIFKRPEKNNTLVGEEPSPGNPRSRQNGLLEKRDRNRLEKRKKEAPKDEVTAKNSKSSFRQALSFDPDNEEEEES